MCAHSERRFAAWRKSSRFRSFSRGLHFWTSCCATSLKFVSSPSTTHMTPRSARLSALWRKESRSSFPSPRSAALRTLCSAFTAMISRRSFPCGAQATCSRRSLSRPRPPLCFINSKLTVRTFCAPMTTGTARASAQAARVFVSRCISAASKRLRNSAAASCIRFFPTASAFPTTILHRQALNITAASGKRRKCTEA